MNIYKLRNQFGYTTTSIIRFACHNRLCKNFKIFCFLVIVFSFKSLKFQDIKLENNHNNL
jgi:hypothetical protein